MTNTLCTRRWTCPIVHFIHRSLWQLTPPTRHQALRISSQDGPCPAIGHPKSRGGHSELVGLSCLKCCDRSYQTMDTDEERDLQAGGGQNPLLERACKVPAVRQCVRALSINLPVSEPRPPKPCCSDTEVVDGGDITRALQSMVSQALHSNTPQNTLLTFFF